MHEIPQPEPLNAVWPDFPDLLTIEAELELLRIAEEEPDATLGFVKETLILREKLDVTMNLMAARMSSAADSKTAENAFRWLHFSYRADTKKRIKRALNLPEGMDLDDTTQDVWCSIWGSRHSFRPGAPFTPWMWTIVNRRIADWLEKWCNRWSKLKSIEDYPNLEEKSADNGECDRLYALREAIKLLPRSYQIIINLRFERDCPLEKIAAVIKLPLSTVKIQNARALQKLRDLLSAPPAHKQNKKSSQQGRTNHVHES
jgi:RNA polymerase sigma factor (sigma-70 family)